MPPTRIGLAISVVQKVSLHMPSTPYISNTNRFHQAHFSPIPFLLSFKRNKIWLNLKLQVQHIKTVTDPEARVGRFVVVFLFFAFVCSFWGFVLGFVCFFSCFFFGG